MYTGVVKLIQAIYFSEVNLFVKVPLCLTGIHMVTVILEAFLLLIPHQDSTGLSVLWLSMHLYQYLHK